MRPTPAGSQALPQSGCPHTFPYMFPWTHTRRTLTVDPRMTTEDPEAMHLHVKVSFLPAAQSISRDTPLTEKSVDSQPAQRDGKIRRGIRATEKIFGVILAGGQSRRFGQAKVLAALGGAPMASWGVRALQGAGLSVGVVSDEEGVEAALGIPARPDLVAGLGPMGGLWTALQWAQERGDDGVLLLGCDMPLVNEAVLRTVLSWSDTAPAVVPLGSKGAEPLCALYRAACTSVVEHRLRSKDLSLHGLAEAVGAVFIGEEAVAAVTDPCAAFLNVNTVKDRDRAERFLDARR